MAKSPNKVLMVRKDRNVVAENACWEEAIKKETKSQVLNEHFQIKFQFHDNQPIPNDGYTIDDVRVQPRTVDSTPTATAATTRHVFGRAAI